ncbi:EAL domain-containing protein (putative c-di-GMP-specific phosphodiesterase class I) [Mycoplana sp. BE70]|uniref:EAL domain-containing protein n=1 Tax=Mycoplana sp. BE70 TaxID=2817775 RepID=UPI00285C569C|nr:EAL domain-containing protein [Mycoplana sp. BE70]MDR6759239.1 EAL domain-containing protein (putative c-di-GMP-specific phosphodiesterase class I) [Mycoplana sp. BE70]
MLEEHHRECKFTIAFQPIVDLAAGTRPYAYEALVRGLNGEAASTILAEVRASDIQAFDAECRKRAVQLAQRLNLSACLSVNISSETVGHACHGLLSTLDDARCSGFAEEKLVFEISERKAIDNICGAKEQIIACKRRGARIAYDDFGVGYSCIAALLEFMPDILKVDMSLIRGIESDNRRRSIMSAIHDVCSRLHTVVIAEGIETRQEMDALRDLGINLMQGYYFARPTIECLPLSVVIADGPGGNRTTGFERRRRGIGSLRSDFE